MGSGTSSLREMKPDPMPEADQQGHPSLPRAIWIRGRIGVSGWWFDAADQLTSPFQFAAWIVMVSWVGGYDYS